MVAVGFVSDVLTMVKVPLAAPAALGSNCTLIVAVWLGFNVSGRVAPETLNPVPATVSKLTDTAAPPVDDRTSDCVAGVFKATLPKATLEELMLSAGPPAPNCREKVCVTPPALAVNEAVSLGVTAEIVAVKLAAVAPAATTTLAGTVTEELLLARPTANPPPAAATFNVTVQLSVPTPVIVPLAQLSALGAGVPVPLKLIKVDVPPEELLVIVSAPVAAPATVGSNCTVSVAV
jgi:hypothetical protein